MNDTCVQGARCCAEFYELPIVGTVLGDIFHPGGATLTRQLASAAGISRESRVLDVACGNGNSARLISADCGAQVTACDYSFKNLRIAHGTTSAPAVAQRIDYVCCDAARLPFATGSFDVVICECSLCLFDNPDAVLAQIHSMLSPGGRIGITDFFLNKPVPVKLQGLLGSVLCVAGACSAGGYRHLLERNGFDLVRVRRVNWALADMLQRVRHRLKTLHRMGALDGSLGDRHETEAVLSELERFISDGGAGYLLAIGHRQADQSRSYQRRRIESA